MVPWIHRSMDPWIHGSMAHPGPPGAPPEPPRAGPEPAKALQKLLQTLPQALPGPLRAMPRFGGVQGRSGLALTVKTRGFRTIWNSSPEPREPPEPGKWWQDPRLGPPIPHAPGARMTAVTQTPSKNCLSMGKGSAIKIYKLRSTWESV